MSRPVQDWARFTVGERFGPYRYEVTQAVVTALRTAVGDWSLTSVGGEQVAPAMILTFPFLQLIESAYVPRPGVIHAEQEFELRAPVRVGATLTCTGRLTSMFLRRERRYFRVTAQAADERGTVVARSITTALYPDVDLRPTGG